MPVVRYLATLKGRLGVEEERIEARVLKDLLKGVSSRVPDLLDFDGRPSGLYVILVNGMDYRLLGEEYKLEDDDEVTIIPVIHGG